MSVDDIKRAASDTARKADKSLSHAKTSASLSVEDLGENASSFMDDVSGKASDLYDKAKDTAADYADRIPSASEAMATGRTAYKSGSDQVLKQVAKQPIEALLLAGAIGYLVGWAANRG